MALSLFSKKEDLKIDHFGGGDNFEDWKQQMTILLQHLNMWKWVVSEPDPKPDEDVLRQAQLTILLFLKVPQQREIMKYTTEPWKSWQQLATKYAMTSTTLEHSIKKQLYTKRFLEGGDLPAHIKEFEDLLNQLERIPDAALPEREIPFVFYAQMPQVYHTQMTLLADKNSKWPEIRRAMLSEDTRLKDYQNSEQALYVRAPPQQRLSNKFCDFHQMPGHSTSECRAFQKEKNAHAFSPARTPTTTATTTSSPATSGHNTTTSSSQPPPHRKYGMVTILTMRLNSTSWIIDSGASCHMTGYKHILSDFQTMEPENVYFGDNYATPAIGYGTVTLDFICDGKRREIELQQVIYVPNLECNLFSVPKALDSGVEIRFCGQHCIVLDDLGTSICTGSRRDSLFILDCQQIQALATIKPATSTLELWHRRIGHISTERIIALSHGLVDGITITNTETNLSTCKSCIIGKSHRAPIANKQLTIKTTRKLELIHSDVCGPLPTASIGGARYFITITDDFSRYTVIYLMTTKSQVINKLKAFFSVSQTQQELKIKALRCDHGGEYTSKTTREFLESNGTILQMSAPYTPQQNGVAERKNRTLMEMTRCMLHDANLPPRFWGEALMHAAFLINHTPTSVLKGVTPQEIWTGVKPSLKNLKVFGSLAYVHLPDGQRTKLQPRVKQCIYLGTAADSAGYRLYDSSTNKIITSRDVSFDEHAETRLAESNTDDHQFYMPPLDLLIHPERAPAEIQQIAAVNSDVMLPEQPPPEADDNLQADDFLHQNPGLHDNDDQARLPAALTNEAQHEGSDDDLQPQQSKSVPLSSQANKQQKPKYAKAEIDSSNIVNTKRISTSSGKHHTTLIMSTTHPEPKTFQEAINGPLGEQWLQAAQEEFDALINNGTWILVPLPKGRKAIACKWVFKYKFDAEGVISRFKARLVAKGFTQIPGIDFTETFAPVARIISIRVLLAIAIAERLHIWQMDVDTAFLNGTLEEDIYMEQPEGFITTPSRPSDPNLVCLLKRTLYGLKQAGWSWHEVLDQFLTEIGFTKTSADICIYIKSTQLGKIIIAVYVDDLLILTTSITDLETTKKMLSERFKMKDLGAAHHLLGIKIHHDHENGTISLNQKAYIQKILAELGMTDCNSSPIPISSHDIGAIIDVNDQKPADAHLYRQAVGLLIYAMGATRPDIAFAVGYASRHMANPSSQHWTMVKRIIRYLQGTCDHSLTYRHSESQSITLSGYSDADWGGNHQDRKSTTGYQFFINNCLISWCSRKQQSVALSSTEAEYMAITAAAKEAIWLRQLLADLGHEQHRPTIVYSDNQSAISLTKNPAHHDRTKHIDIRHHFIRDLVRTGQIQLRHCPTSQMLADICTKALPREKHEAFSLQSLNGILPNLELAGGY